MTVRTATTVAVPAETYRDDVWQARNGRKARFHPNHAAEIANAGWHQTTFRGDGPTVSAARADLAVKLAAFLGDHRRPVILRHNRWTIILAAGFDLEGPCIERTQIGPDDPDTDRGRWPSRCGYDWDDEIRRAKAHLAQLACRDQHDDQAVLDTLRWLDDDQLGADFLGDCAFQRAYRHAESIGAADPHRWTWDKRAQFLPDLPAHPAKEAA